MCLSKYRKVCTLPGMACTASKKELQTYGSRIIFGNQAMTWSKIQQQIVRRQIKTANAYTLIRKLKVHIWIHDSWQY